MPMRSSQADRFEQHVQQQLTKWIGAVPVLMPILRDLGVAETVDAHCPGKDEVSHGTIITALALNRLLAPKPLYKVGEWLSETVLEDALGVDAEQMYDSRLGRTLDDLHPRLEGMWQEIVAQAIITYDIDWSRIHYDITSIYFEGEYEDSETIDYGYSRDHRPDAKQINLAVNVTGEEGIPLAYRVLAGRTADRTTPQENMGALRQLLEQRALGEEPQDFLLISDRAMLDKQVLIAYDQQDVHWLGPLAADGHLGDILAAVSNEELAQAPLDYRPTSQPADEPPRYYGVLRQTTIRHDDQEVPVQLLVVKSRTKVTLDRQRRETYLKRLTDRLREIQSMLNTRRYKRQAYAQQQIAKAQQGNPAQRFVQVELTGNDGALTLRYQVDAEQLAAAEALDGRYLLGTNVQGMTADQMLQHFKEQEVVERRIRTVKGPIQIRPLFLHKEERIEGLVFGTMLALLVYTILEMLCRRAGEYITARQVLEKFELLGAIYTQFADGSWLKLPSVLNDTQQHLIDLLRFPPPATYLRTAEALGE
jgi:transposase